MRRDSCWIGICTGVCVGTVFGGVKRYIEEQPANYRCTLTISTTTGQRCRHVSKREIKHIRSLFPIVGNKLYMV